MSDYYYWVVQVAGGQKYFHGPYSSEQARDKRYEKIEGGEVHKLTTLSPNKEDARQTYSDEEVKAL